MILIIVMVAIVKVLSGGGSPQQRRDSPLIILKAHYARGAIDAEQFEPCPLELKR